MLFTTEEYFEEIRFLLSGIEKLSYRDSFGDQVFVYDGKELGGIYGNRLLVKITPSSRAMLSPTAYCLPYYGVREMFLVESRDPAFLARLFQKIWEELPEPS